MRIARLPVYVLRLLAAGVLLSPGLSAAVPSAAAPPPPPGLTAGEVTAVYGGPHLSACSTNSGGHQFSNDTNFTPVLACSLSVGGDGHLIILANTSVTLDASTDSYEATFALDLNSGGVGDPDTERVVDVHPDDPALLAGGDGTDRNVALTGYYTVTAGVQTVTLLVKRSEGTATMEFINSTLSVLFIPDGIDLVTCGEFDSLIHIKGNTGESATAHCSLEAPRPGLLFVSADGHLAANNNHLYEARTRLNLDDAVTTGVRYTDVYTNTGNGDDTNASVTRVYSVAAGTHTVTLELGRERGPGDPKLEHAALAALYVPFDSPYARACGTASGSNWSNATTSYTALANCSLTAPTDSWVFLSANAGIGYSNTPYEGRFGLGRDSLTPLSPSAHYVNSYDDANDGQDEMVISSLIVPNTAGPHTYYFTGRRGDGAAAGTGTVFARTPVLFVLVPGANSFVPLALK